MPEVLKRISMRWFDQPEFQEKANLFFISQSLQREVSLVEILTMHEDDLRVLCYEIDAGITQMSMKRQIRDAVIHYFRSDHPFSEDDIRKYGFKKMIYFTFSRAVIQELKYRREKEKTERADTRLKCLQMAKECIAAGISASVLAEILHGSETTSLAAIRKMKNEAARQKALESAKSSKASQ